jgi:hypothetical protein
VVVGIVDVVVGVGVVVVVVGVVIVVVVVALPMLDQDAHLILRQVLI